MMMVEILFYIFVDIYFLILSRITSSSTCFVLDTRVMFRPISKGKNQKMTKNIKPISSTFWGMENFVKGLKRKLRLKIDKKNMLKKEDLKVGEFQMTLSKR